MTLAGFATENIAACLLVAPSAPEYTANWHGRPGTLHTELAHQIRDPTRDSPNAGRSPPSKDDLGGSFPRSGISLPSTQSAKPPNPVSAKLPEGQPSRERHQRQYARPAADPVLDFELVLLAWKAEQPEQVQPEGTLSARFHSTSPVRCHVISRVRH